MVTFRLSGDDMLPFWLGPFVWELSDCAPEQPTI